MQVWLIDEQRFESFDGSFSGTDGSVVTASEEGIADVLHAMGAFSTDPNCGIYRHPDSGVLTTNRGVFEKLQDELTLRLQAEDHIENIVRKFHMDPGDVYDWHLLGLWDQEPEDYIRWIDGNLEEWIRRKGFTEEDLRATDD